MANERPTNLTPEQFQHEYQISRAGFYRNLHNGVIPHFRIGKLVRVDRVAWEAKISGSATSGAK